MKGKVKFSAQNARIKFQFVLERNVTIITGDISYDWLVHIIRPSTK